MSANKLKIALIQLAVGASKSDNLQRASRFIADAAKAGAKLVSLPECCNSPYGNTYFPQYAETIPGPSTEVFSKAAQDNQVYLVAGSIPEREGDKLFNTCTVYNPQGELIAKYRKMHLFDIDIPGKITFKESQTLSPGNSFVTFDTRGAGVRGAYCRVGLGICYDIRFPEMAQIYTNKGCELLLYPGAFNMTTGPAHWQKLAQSRALDNQLYVASISPARDEAASYVTWGHTLLASPWGDVVSEAGHEEEIVYSDIDLDYLKGIRDQIPVSKQKRTELYQVKEASHL